MPEAAGLGPVLIRISGILDRNVTLIHQLEDAIAASAPNSACPPEATRIRALQQLDRIEQMLSDCVTVLGTLGTAVIDQPAPDGLLIGTRLQEVRDEILPPNRAPDPAPPDGEIQWL